MKVLHTPQHGALQANPEVPARASAGLAVSAAEAVLKIGAGAAAYGPRRRLEHHAFTDMAGIGGLADAAVARLGLPGVLLQEGGYLAPGLGRDPVSLRGGFEAGRGVRW